MTTGLLLGAGASCEIGMPLVWELTQEIKDWLTPATLNKLNAEWHKQGNGHIDTVIDRATALLQRQELHYEALLGAFEVEFRRDRSDAQELHHLYSWLVELVYHTLYVRHIRNPGFIQCNLSRLEGIARLAELNAPLWIFSLNHDCLIESLAAQHGLAVSAGLSSDTISLPRRDSAGAVIGELTAETLSAEELEHHGMPFLWNGERGINLLKIHGGLDMFTLGDTGTLARILPTKDGVPGILDMLQAANEDLLYRDARLPSGKVRFVNEITYADSKGEMQSLRRSCFLVRSNLGTRRIKPLR